MRKEVIERCCSPLACCSLAGGAGRRAVSFVGPPRFLCLAPGPLVMALAPVRHHTHQLPKVLPSSRPELPSSTAALLVVFSRPRQPCSS